MALQHLRSSTANKRPLPGSMSDGQIAINTNVASPGVFVKDSSGEIVKIGPVHIGTTAPNSSPATGGETGNTTGELWLDTSLTPNELKTWDGSSWVSATGQEIPVSKLIDGSARQLLQTDAAGTGVEWTSNVDVPGTLDVTSTATFDSIASHPLGSAGAPTITFTGDTNTGIYSPGADQLAVATNGTGRLFVNANGKIGVGTASPGSTLTVSDGSASGLAPFGGTDVFIDSDSSNYLQFGTGTSSASAIYFGDTDDGDAGGIAYSHSSDALSFRINAAERARIDSSGRLLVGTSSSVSIADFSETALQVHGIAASSGGRSRLACVRWHNNANPAGISIAKSRSETPGTYTIVQDNDQIGEISFAADDGTDLNTIAARIRAEVDGTPGSNDMPGRLVFSTTADGASTPTERMRISNDGTVEFKNGIKETVYTLGTSGTIALDPVNGSIQSSVLTGAPTFTDSLAAGQTIVLHLEGGASYTVTWPTITWVTGSGNAAPTLTAKDTLVLWKISTTLYGAYVGSYA